ncbi:hypothetical protein LTR99_010958 [Exophiala xenobiotica]|uniref:Uncharacterized protein n=1 Tax=Vermiconidia calcicola TaxID=1690605 RepID=A0AAV9QGM7_9PEZI|nr:hypothetical protein LTR99_010958 [Exophiala xenobiotica]KAK5430801.1 hypothetical protein LTR34_005360 [Exophiala xenobiotica]KAK5531190.1 hypothetical protein LTR23_010053 [Chaetothyriales sp. CCFEE 6169]KAK5541360.1 hypothetical protein LTR25_003137 [Vermiconidia calcicola]
MASYSNEGPPSDAALYIGIQRCRSIRDVPGENRCWAYLKPNKRKHLKQFLSQHVAIAASFNNCLSWPPLWHPTRIGVFHKIVASRCYEEVIAYIDDICLFFGTVSEAGKLEVTDTDVQALQGRCPYLSESDRQYLQKSMDEEEFLGHLDHDSKAQFFSETAKYPKTIPSFYTFFEDFKYIMLCSEVLKYILSARELPKGSTLRTCFYEIYQFSQQMVTQIGAADFVRAPTESHRDAFLWAYQQLWLCSMRLWPYLLPQKPRKDKKMEDGRFQIKIDTVIYWAQIANTCESLGFQSDRIRQLATTERSLNITDGQRYDGFVATDTASSFRIESRCGIPFGCTTDLDRNSLFINKLLIPQILPAKDITAFFVRRVLLQRLFPEATELYASCSRAYRTAVFQNSSGASREPRSVTAGMRSGSSSTRQRRSRSPRTGQTLNRERAALETYYLTIYNASDKVNTLALSQEERILRARQLQSQGYRLLTENVNHIEESSLDYFVERKLLAVNERNVDLNLFRSRMGLVVSSPDDEMDII